MAHKKNIEGGGKKGIRSGVQRKRFISNTTLSQEESQRGGSKPSGYSGASRAGGGAPRGRCGNASKRGGKNREQHRTSPFSQRSPTRAQGSPTYLLIGKRADNTIKIVRPGRGEPRYQLDERIKNERKKRKRGRRERGHVRVKILGL